MIFWDSSALVALIVNEPDSEMRKSQLAADPELAVWWGTPVECESAIQCRLRAGVLGAKDAKLAQDRLADLSASWYEVTPSVAIRKLALRILRTHPLCAVDSLQLAAALALHAAGIRDLRFACSDERLVTAAEIEDLRCV